MTPCKIMESLGSMLHSIEQEGYRTQDFCVTHVSLAVRLTRTPRMAVVVLVLVAVAVVIFVVLIQHEAV